MLLTLPDQSPSGEGAYPTRTGRAPQGYLLVLLKKPPCLLGLAYLALLVPVLVAPPLRGTYVKTDGLGQPAAPARTAVRAVLRGGAGHPGAPHAQPSRRRRRSRARQGRPG